MLYLGQVMLPRRLKETQAYQRFALFTKRNERLLMPSMLVGGTALDAVQFRVLQIQTTFLISGIYAVICGTAIILMVAKLRENQRIARFLQVAAPLLQQFTIGALLSTALLFYWFSGSFSVSWPLIGAIALMMVSNEVLRRQFTKPVVQVGVFYFALFSLCATLSAFVMNSLSPVVFVLGGIASLIFMAAFLVLVISVGKLEHKRSQMWLTVTGIFACMNIFYFLNLIPPIPLSMRDAGIYDNVTRSGGEYVLEGKTESWWQKLVPGQRIAIEPGQRVYAYAAISAPAELSTTIYHRWEYRDGERGWITRDRLSYGISGGRDEGYRGYSYKTSVTPGKWRVTVETERGQVLGRIGFTAEYE